MHFELWACIALATLFFVAIPALIFLTFEDKQY